MRDLWRAERGAKLSQRARMLAGGFYERTSGAAGQALGHSYQRRTPEHTVLHELVSRHAQTLIAELRDADGCGLPRYVDRELAEYLRCGMLAHGFARVRCQACDDEILVAFSCKRRGICPSCLRSAVADSGASASSNSARMRWSMLSSSTNM